MKIEENKNYNKSDLQPHKGIWLLFMNTDNKILMLYHNKFEQWTILLEKSEPGEDLHNAIIRSGMEEVGVEIIRYETIKSVKQKYLRNNVKLNIEAFFIKIQEYNGVPENLEPDKHKKLEWRDKDFAMNLTDELDANVALKEYLTNSVK